jgi:hypothetical protein
VLSEGSGDGELYLTFGFEFEKDVDESEVEGVWKGLRDGVGKSMLGIVRGIRVAKG